MWQALNGLSRYIATARVSKHRLFGWQPAVTVPDSATIAIAREDDAFFGVLHSRMHELWALGLCSWLGVGNDPRYTPTSTFETFPFPESLLQGDESGARQGMTEAARRVDELRSNWLNPPEWVDRVPEIIEGLPDRLIPRPGREAELNQRTLTDLYNTRPAWLLHAHEVLDAAVAEAYGWNDYSPAMEDEEILRRLLGLNLSRPAQG